MKRRSTLLTLIFSLLTALLGASWVHADERIHIKGSDTMVFLNQEWAAAYQRAYPGAARIEVTGGGSNRGIEALLDGSTDIAASSRPLHSEELNRFEEQFGARPVQVPVALDGMGIYVHSSNQLTRLTFEQVRGIFTGEITNWRDVGGPNRPIHVFSRDRFSGTYTYFKERVLQGRDYGAQTRFISTTNTLISLLSRDRWGIGYGGIAYAQGTHVIRLAEEDLDGGAFPTIENVASGKYPLSRPLYFYVAPDVWKRVKPFVDWVRGDTGQDVVKLVGYYPLGSEARLAKVEAAGSR